MNNLGRGSEFIQLYNQLVDHLRDLTGADRGVNFPQLVSMAARKDQSVRRHAARIREYADLRNAMVHYRSFPEEFIAEPTEEAVATFREIVEGVVSPKPLLPAYRKEVRVFSTSDRLVTILVYMRDRDYAQVAVRDGGSLMLLTLKGIARWLLKQANADTVNVAQATVRDALAFDDPKNCVIMSGSQTIYDAQQAFIDALVKEKRRLFAIIVTETGKPDEDPAGIITPGDLMETWQK